MKKVKIYGTLGPACSRPGVLKKMFEEGMDGIRLNLSHTSLDEAAGAIASCFDAAACCGVSPEFMIDMQGPELRIGSMAEPLELTDGELIGIGDIPFPQTVSDVLHQAAWQQDAEDQEILLDDGRILLRMETGLEEGALQIRLRVMRGGVLTGRKSVALPGRRIDTPSMTDADRANIISAKRYGVTAVMQPFVRGRDDLIEVREALDAAGGRDIRLFAKIENLSGLDKLDELIPYCDEIVIARGDLGNAMELWQLPAAQKRIAEACRAAGRDFMVVTQMLDSMTHRQVPTRAEVSDIFNAVLDGAASVMVTGETAAGDYPDLVIRYMSKTVREAEAYRDAHIETAALAVCEL